MDPVTAAKLAKIAAQQLRDENKRKRVVTIALTILGFVLFLYSIAVYIVTHPVDAIFGEHSGEFVIENGSEVAIRNYSNIQDTVWNYLKNIGFSDCGAAGVMGNIQAESSFDTSSCHSGIYHGLCQWGLGRWDGNSISLKSFAELKKRDWTDLQTQLSFFKLECQQSYHSVFEQMTLATDVQYACDYFCTKYEVCTGKLGDWAYSMVDGKPYQALGTRRRNAVYFYNHYASQNVLEKGEGN